MQLRLTVTRHNGAAPSVPLTATLSAQGGSIGRHPGNALELPDRSMEVSRQHARIEFRDGEFCVTDTSRNGLLLNGAMVGTGETTRIANGDLLVAGGYEIEVAIEADPAGEPIREARRAPPDDPFAESMPATPTPAAKAFDADSTMPRDRGLLGEDAPRDVLDVLEEGSPLAAAKSGDTPLPAGDFRLHQDRTPAHAESLPRMDQPDHLPPETTPARDIPSGGGAGPVPAPSEAALPTDWMLRSDQPDDAPQAAVSAEPPVVQPAEAEVVSRSAPPTPGRHKAGEETLTPSADPLLEAFLEGLQLKDFDIDGDEATAVLELAGRILRETVHGVRRVLIARSKIKDTFRLPVTRLQQMENNPLKFSVGVEDALEKLLELDPKGYLPPVESVREVFEDLEIHEIAVITGMRAALERVLTRFEPGALEKRMEAHFLDSVVPAARKARLWEMFTEHYEVICREAKDAFDQLYGREFAQAYETEIRTLKTQHARNDGRVDPSAPLNLGSARRDER